MGMQKWPAANHCIYNYNYNLFTPSGGIDCRFIIKVLILVQAIHLLALTALCTVHNAVDD